MKPLAETINRTGYFKGSGSRRLFYQSWTTPSARGIFVITHGLSENTDRYDSLARLLNQDQWNVYAWDLRGHGRSSGIRGYVRQFRLYERDLVHFLNFVLLREKSLPFVLFGHSLGALIIARGLFHEEDIISSASAVCLTAPALGLRVNLSLFKLFVSHIAKLVCPWWAYYNRVLSRHLSKDPYFINLIENDVFRHNKLSPEIYLTVLNNDKEICIPQRLQSRLLIQLAGNDVIVDNTSAVSYFECVQSSKPRQMICYPSSMHQLLEDSERKRVIQDLKLFIKPLLV